MYISKRKHRGNIGLGRVPQIKDTCASLENDAANDAQTLQNGAADESVSPVLSIGDEHVGDHNTDGGYLSDRAKTGSETGMPDIIEGESVDDGGETGRENDALAVEREMLIVPNVTEKDTAGDLAENDGMGKTDITVPQNPQVLDPDDESTLDMTYEQFMDENRSSGVLRVQASAGGDSIPLVNVNIKVYKDFTDGRHIFYHVTTNADGVADGMILAAPPRENSIIGNGESPFASYTVEASRDGLVTEIVENVPIFDGIKSIQPITMSATDNTEV